MTQMIDPRSLIHEIDPASHPAAGNDDATTATTPVPAWVDHLRAAGRDHFQGVGLPTSKDEEWRQINLAPITKTPWALPASGSDHDPAHGVTIKDIAGFAIPDLDAHTLVFVDGRFDAALSDAASLPEGVIACSLAAAFTDRPQLLQPHLARHATANSEAFTALNTAHLADGAFIRVPRGVIVDKPIHLLFVSTAGDKPTMTHPRVLFVVEDRAGAEVIEHHVGLGEGAYFTNAVTEVVVGDHARASHYFIERDTDVACNVATLQVHQGAESDFASHSVLLGGKLVRNNVNPVLAGENSHSLLNGLYLPDGQRHFDNHMRVHHTQPGCESRQHYAGVLQDKGSGAFVGRIVVDRPAQQTDAVQASRVLLLSDDAHAHNRPQLEIFADDVKCTHGVTIGELDEQAIFYLRARGIPEATARGMLTYAFANEALDRMTLEPVRREMARLLLKRLHMEQSIGQVME